MQNQTYTDIEIIVVDNFSSDGTYEVAEKYASKVFQK
jgi:glycosyltransferase involved in cell wall biosynthesis